MAMIGRSNSSQYTWTNAWPFSFFPLAKTFRRISLKSFGLTVSHTISRTFYTPLSSPSCFFALAFLLNFIQLHVV